jgi:hypothetical protein
MQASSKAALLALGPTITGTAMGDQYFGGPLPYPQYAYNPYYPAYSSYNYPAYRWYSATPYAWPYSSWDPWAPYSRVNPNWVPYTGWR